MSEENMKKAVSNSDGVIAPSDVSGVIAPSDIEGVIAPSDLSGLSDPSGFNRFEIRVPRQLTATSLLPIGIGFFALIICAALGFGPARDQLEGLLNPPITSEPVRPRESVPTEPVVTDPPTDEPTRVRPVEVAPGYCEDECNPAVPTSCLAGLTCVQKAEGSAVYICWNASICSAIVTESANPEVTEPSVTEASTQPVVECGPGWLPASGCVCCASTLVCADGTVAQFNPACMSGGTDGGAGDVCGDGVCSAAESAACGSCSADCGPC